VLIDFKFTGKKANMTPVYRENPQVFPMTHALTRGIVEAHHVAVTDIQQDKRCHGREKHDTIRTHAWFRNLFLHLYANSRPDTIPPSICL
jgi:hypothetical protein